jgi:hypothetical protein
VIHFSHLAAALAQNRVTVLDNFSDHGVSGTGVVMRIQNVKPQKLKTGRAAAVGGRAWFNDFHELRE